MWAGRKRDDLAGPRRSAVERSAERPLRAPEGDGGAQPGPGGLAPGGARVVGRRDPPSPDPGRSGHRQADLQALQGRAAAPTAVSRRPQGFLARAAAASRTRPGAGGGLPGARPCAGPVDRGPEGDPGAQPPVHRAPGRGGSARAQMAPLHAGRDGPGAVVAAARAARGRSSRAAARREGRPGLPALVKVILRNPRKEIEVDGKRRVKELLVELDILPSTVLVIRGNELLTGDTVVGGDDVLEVRPVMSGGSARTPRSAASAGTPPL